MNDIGVIDTYFATFNRYIDSGFGLLSPHVGALANILVAIDVTLAALMWSLAAGEDILARLIRKVLYVGFFAFLIGNFQSLSALVLASFTQLGLTAGGAGVSADEMLRPGRLAAVGVASAKPFLEAAADLCGFPAFFENIVQVLVLLVAFLLVVVAFFIIAVQVFVVLIEFKIATLIGFALVPFGLFGRTAFMAERVLGAVLASGVKVMALAVIVGIGSTLFDAFSVTWTDGQPTLEQALALVLASLVLLGLSIFCPGIASGLISGAPQLGLGAAVGTGLTVGGMAVAGVAAAQMAAGAASGAAAGLASKAALADGAGGGPRPSPPTGGAPTSPGPSTPPPQGGGAGSGSGSSSAGSTSTTAGPGASASDPAPSQTDPGDQPRWARDLKQRQDLAHGASLAAHGLASGDDHSGGASPSLSES